MVNKRFQDGKKKSIEDCYSDLLIILVYFGM